jgi:hypothetical protein
VSGARDDFLSGDCRSLNVLTQISSQRNFSRYQATWGLNDQTLQAIRPAHIAHCYRARVGGCLFELLDIRHCDLSPEFFVFWEYGSASPQS